MTICSCHGARERVLGCARAAPRPGNHDEEKYSERAERRYADELFGIVLVEPLALGDCIYDGGARRACCPPSEPTASQAAVETPIATDESQAASQVASFAVTKLKDSPAVVTVVSGEDIRAMGARDLVDILNFVPGFFQGVDLDGVVGPGFRGLWGHEGKILLLIDGKEMNELLFSNMQLGNEFPVEFIERVEVVRGPGSVIYGGSAELGVINVVTRGLQGATDAMVTGTYGRNDRRKQRWQ